MRLMTAVFLAALTLPVAATAQTLEKIKETGELVIGFRTDAAPLSFVGDNSPQGYAPALCFAIAPSLAVVAGIEDMNVIFETVTTEDRFQKVADGEIDMLCGAASITLTRRELVDFS